MIKDFKNSNFIFVANSQPDLHIIRHLINCTKSNKIDVKNQTNIHTTNVTKFIMNDTIYEKHVVYMEGETYEVDVQCKHLPNSLKFYSNHKNLKPQKFISGTENLFSTCCLNETHLLQVYGYCNEIDLSSTSTLGQNYKYGQCNMISKNYVHT